MAYECYEYLKSAHVGGTSLQHGGAINEGCPPGKECPPRGLPLARGGALTSPVITDAPAQGSGGS